MYVNRGLVIGRFWLYVCKQIGRFGYMYVNR